LKKCSSVAQKCGPPLPPPICSRRSGLRGVSAARKVLTQCQDASQTSGSLCRASPHDLVATDDSQERQARSSGDLWPAARHGGTSLWESSIPKTLGPLYRAGKDHSKHSVDVLLYGP